VVELAEIFRRHGPAYKEKHGPRMLPSHRRAMRDIEQCRTEALGGQVYHCPNCEQARYSYHSCKNRHCPKCQNDAAQQWLVQQQELLLPVPYFLLTFTLPAGLRNVVRSNQKCMYNFLFRTSAAATQKLARDPRFVGGQIGLIGVLHTWARNLTYHPHVHYLVPAGGLSADGQTWLPSGEDFLIPVKPLGIIFRAKFRHALQRTDLFDSVSAKIWTQDWVVHCQPAGNGLAALKYLAPYIFRVAISNHRIRKLAHDRVSFCYQDTDTGATRTCTLSAQEFIRRFLQHVLPKGFVKVRYYGFFSPGKRRVFPKIRRLLGFSGAIKPMDDHQTNAMSLVLRCPTCGQEMRLVETLRPNGRRPP